ASLQIGILAADSTPVRPISQWVHTSWTAKDGAPTRLLALAQTSDGYLWIGTLAGLVRFDGVRFVPFVPRGGDSLPSGGVRRLLAARDGSLWLVGRSGAVSHLRDGRLTVYGEREGLPHTFQLAESSTGMLVAGTAKGLASFVDGKWKDVGPEWRFPGKESRAVWFDREDVLWVQTESRVIYRPAGGPDFVDPDIPLRGRPYVADFAQTKDGTIWMGELGRSAHTLRRLGDPSPTTEVMVGSQTLLIDRKGTLWIGSAGDGLRRVIDPARIRGQSIGQFGPEAEHFTQTEGLLSNITLALLEDREGNIWVASPRGLERFREGAFTPIPIAGSIRARFVFAARDTSIWTGAFNTTGLLRIGQEGSEPIETNGAFLRFVVEDSVGDLWGTMTDYLFRVHGRRVSPVQLAGVTPRALSQLAVDPAGTLWLFDDGLGLLRVSHDSLVLAAPLAQASPLGSVLFSDRRGRLWVGQGNRVALYDHGQVKLFAAAEGLGPAVVRSFLEDRGGNIWAVGDEGISKFDGDRFRALPERQGLPGRAVLGITEDELGGWWMVTIAGILQVAPGEVDRALQDSTYAIRYRSFDHLDGLPGVITPGWGSIITRSVDGRIWVATDSGVASVDPRNLPRGPPPPVLVEVVRVDGRELRPTDAMTIPPRSSDLEIDYTATSLAIPERVTFRYQLEGEDPAWREVGTRRRAYYTGLGPGAYRFRVMASNGDGVWNETGATLSFRVLPAWYQTRWFQGAVVLLIIGFGAVTASLLQRRRHLREQQVLISQHQATLSERARIAQDLHDTLLQGFAGVALQLKSVELALPEQPDVAVETLLRVQQLARASLREARERVWDMHETDLGSDDLPAALEGMARERTGGTGVEISVVTAGSRRRLPRPVEDAAFRIGREAVVNVIRHAEARRVEIHTEFGANTFRLEVRDDGRGFTTEEAEAAHRQGHFGLSGVQERARAMGGRCDLLPRPGGGTIMALELPVSEP
ncbi:MAG TPA: two-component regulator propeller domain-containing protein, partial [Gemmatimonadales bacterium]|nr:two-component regulator propeller domain-containing protein [Gemmatimonadales bacterium]